MSRKVDEIIGRQENTLSLVSRGFAGQAGQAVPPPAAGSVPQQVPQLAGGVAVTRQDVDLLIANQNVLLTSIREIRQITDNIQINQKNAPTAQIQSSGYDVQTLIVEMRDGMNQVKQGISHVGQRWVSVISSQLIRLIIFAFCFRLGMPQAAAQTGSCPTGNCVGVTLFLSVTVVQLLLVFIYNIFK